MKLTKKLINTIGILTIVAVTAFVTDTVTNVDASVQKEVLTAKGDLYKSEKDRVFNTIKIANDQGYYQMDDYGIAWNGHLKKDETYSVDVYETDEDQEYRFYKFHFAASWNYVYYEDIVKWYPSLKGKYVNLVISKPGTRNVEAYGFVNDKKIPKESIVEPKPDENTKEASGGNYIPVNDGIITVSYDGKTFKLHNNGSVEVVK